MFYVDENDITAKRDEQVLRGIMAESLRGIMAERAARNSSLTRDATSISCSQPASVLNRTGPLKKSSKRSQDEGNNIIIS